MPRRLLTISNKLLSLRGHIRVDDDAGQPAYVAQGELAFFPTWRVRRAAGESEVGDEVIRIRRKVFAIRPTWLVNTDNEDFQIKRKLLTFRRSYYAEGESYQGTTLTGNLLDLKFSIERNGQQLARAAGKILTLRDVHSIEVLSEHPIDELFVVAVMMVLQLERRDEAAAQHDQD